MDQKVLFMDGHQIGNIRFALPIDGGGLCTVGLRINQKGMRTI